VTWASRSNLDPVTAVSMYMSSLTTVSTAHSCAIKLQQMIGIAKPGVREVLSDAVHMLADLEHQLGRTLAHAVATRRQIHRVRKSGESDTIATHG
jgi:hypothetical protein